MADIVEYILFLEFFDDESFDRECKYICDNVGRRILFAMCKKREAVPRIDGYILNVVKLMDDPTNIDDFRTHFRVSRDLFFAILGELHETLSRNGRGPNETVTPEKQLLVGLCYISNHQSMREIGHLFDLSQSTVHGVVQDVFHALVQLGPKMIKWPSPQRQREIAREVESACSLPGVVGFLDGTHIRLSSALQGDKDYYNRKGFPSMQLQVVVDNDLRILDAYTGWPGCVHDARVLRNSSLYQKAEAGTLFLQDHHILADNAYPLRNWLITPFKNFGNLSGQQIKFNKRLSSVRQTVERTFGHLKGRFRLLRDIPIHDHMQVCKIIYAACVLHNMCIEYNDDLEGFMVEDNQRNVNQFQNVYQNGHAGVLRRMQLVNIP